MRREDDAATVPLDHRALCMRKLAGILDYECDELAALYSVEEGFRSRVVMGRHGFGRGEYKYFAYPLPGLVAALRTSLYRHLAPIANRWSAAMGIEIEYPAAHASFLEHCHEAGQLRPTPLLLQYGEGDYNCLHQDLYGEHVFPLQVAILLSEPERDFTGGELVMTEQRPRMQSRPMVLPLRQATRWSSPSITGQSGALEACIGSSSGMASAACARGIATRSASSSTTPPEPCALCPETGESARQRTRHHPGQALAMSLPGMGSASAVRHSGAPNALAKYCVSWTTCSFANSMMLTE